jgi:hypothetical protein
MAEAVQRGQSDDVTAMLFGDPEPGRSALARQGVEKPLDLQRGLAERAKESNVTSIVMGDPEPGATLPT